MIETLELFNEKAARLNELRFVREAHLRKPSFHFLPGEGGVELRAEGVATREELEAFALTLRFFLQGSDGISLRQISQLYSSRHGFEDLATEIESIRAWLDAYLNTHSPLVEVDDNRQLTNRELVDMVLYGSLAHANTEHRRRWKLWTGGGFEPLTESEFAVVAVHVVQAIFWVRQVNLRALGRLRAASAPEGIALSKRDDG